MTEIELAAITTRETAALLGKLASAGLRRIIDEGVLVVYAWHYSRDWQRSAVVVISRKTGRVVRGGISGEKPYPLRGRALMLALEGFAGREGGWGWYF